jgi:hypothetical protein
MPLAAFDKLGSMGPSSARLENVSYLLLLILDEGTCDVMAEKACASGTIMTPSTT